MNDYLLGIDLGTTNIKAVIYNTQGVALASASATYALHFPGPNIVEQDANDWWAAAVDILRQVTASAGAGCGEWYLRNFRELTAAVFAASRQRGQHPAQRADMDGNKTLSPRAGLHFEYHGPR